MANKSNFHRQRKTKKKMEPSVSSLASLLKVVDWFTKRFCRPKLELVYSFKPTSQGVAHAGEVHFSIKNSGRMAAKGAVVNLIIAKPLNILPGDGLFFDETLGCLEHSDAANLWDFSKWGKPKHYRYRLKPEVFVNPAPDCPLTIFHTVFSAVPSTAPEELDHEIEWRISCADLPSKPRKIILEGSDLKRRLIADLYESGHIMGHEISSNELPSNNSEKL